MKISAIIPAYNAERFLERAVNSLLDTSYPDLEVVIVDDGSTDRTWSVAQSLSRLHSEVQIFTHHDCENHGVSAARNLGLTQCTGELICFLDADDYVLPHRFDVAVSLLVANPQVDAVHELAKMEFEQGKNTEKFWDQDEIFGVRDKSMSACSFQTILRGVCWNPACILARKELLDKTGNFPEDYKFAEDYHLWLRMVCVGNVVAGNDSEPVSVYYRHAANTYKGGLLRKTDVIRAMTEVYGWLRNSSNSCVDRNKFAELVCDYIRNALILTREEGRCDIGRNIVRTFTSSRFVPAIQDSQLLRQSFWVLAGKDALQHH